MRVRVTDTAGGMLAVQDQIEPGTAGSNDRRKALTPQNRGQDVTLAARQVEPVISRYHPIVHCRDRDQGHHQHEAMLDVEKQQSGGLWR